MSDINNDSQQRTAWSQEREQLLDLLQAMMMELRFRGCDDEHKLIRRARALSQASASKT